jgi:anti-sigma factor RsiW
VTCRELADFLLDYASGELASDVRDAFERHLGACSNCREYLALYLKSVELGRHACAYEDALAIAAGVPDDLVEAILAARS